MASTGKSASFFFKSLFADKLHPGYFTLSDWERRFSIGFQRHRDRKADRKSALRIVGVSCGA
jgi:hypothetical protein